jgi:hypothetical protein
MEISNICSYDCMLLAKVRVSVLYSCVLDIGAFLLFVCPFFRLLEPGVRMTPQKAFVKYSDANSM